jgi:hypothetical protein
LDDIILESIKEVVFDIATESLREGSNAKRASEILSGIYIPTPVYLQYSTYCLLRDIWKHRKRELINNIQIGIGSKQKFETDLKVADPSGDSAAKEAERRRMLADELARQATLCSEMAAEEKNCKAFYHWELLENLRERRLMKEEEVQMRQLMKEEELAAIAAQSAYNVVGEGGGGQPFEEKKKPVVTAFDRRRNELKELAMERRRNTEESEQMRKEDAAGKRLREIDKKERQAKDLIKQLGLEKEAEALLLKQEEEARRKIAEAVSLAGDPVDPRNVIPPPLIVPDWVNLPENWSSMKYNMQKRFLDFQFKMKEYEYQHKQKLAKELKIRQIVERKSAAAWKDRYNALMINTWTNELDYMTKEDERKENEYRLLKLKDNVRKLMTFCQRKGEEELRMKSTVAAMEDNARQKDKEYEDALAWENLCADRSKKRSKLKRRVETDCLWADTDSINGFMQRYRTERLRARLYWEFFREIVASIIVRSEIITTERNLMLAQEKLSLNRLNLNKKTALMKALWRDHQRNELLRTRRSKLNETLFPLHRKEVLKERFTGWVRFFFWNRGHKEAFQLKYEVLKRKMDIERQFKDQLLKNKQEKNNDVSTFTAMRLHGNRVVQCSVCKQFYLEAQNMSTACYFHSGDFKISCPRSCKSPGLSSVCIAHKKMRWTCCDSGDHNALGCARRHHIPNAVDPVYEEVMKKINERDRAEVEELDAKLEVAHVANWEAKAFEINRKQLVAIEDEIGTGREIAARYKSLKIVQHVSDDIDV